MRVKTVLIPSAPLRHHASDKPGLWTGGQLRAFLSVSTMWIPRRLKSDPTFPRPIKLGARNFWRIEAIEEWLKRHEITS